MLVACCAQTVWRYCAQAFLTRLLTVDLPGMMVLPKRLEINIPPGLTSVAEAAVGRDAVMRAVASAVLQSDSLEHALIAALPLGPQSPAGGVSLPDSFKARKLVLMIDHESASWMQRCSLTTQERG